MSSSRLEVSSIIESGTRARDFEKLCRYLVDDFVIQYCRNLGKQDFTIKNENFPTKRKRKREYFNDSHTGILLRDLNQCFQSKVDAPRIRLGEQRAEDP